LELQRIAQRKLDLIDAADELGDLRAPPGNRLEKLAGERRGQYSIRINNQWRICFKLDTIHPGEILLEEFLKPLKISQYRLAKDINVSPRRINEIVHGKRSISADTALRLARYFGTTDRFWLNMQTRYDLEIEKDRLGKRLYKEVGIYRQLS
jgi:addiction module HigA family antidote